MDTKKVLLIDDSPKVIGEIKNLLTAFPINYFQAGSEFGLYNSIEPYGKLVDAIILDVSTKNLDTMAVIEKLRTNNKYSKIPIVLVADSVNKDLVIKAKTLHVEAFMTKPLVEELFRSKMKSILVI